MRSIATLGWRAQPIYVGFQAPTGCSTISKARITPGLEWPQGRDSALDAIVQAQALGIGPGSDIYYDMEAYTPTTACSESVLRFLSGWSSTLRSGGYSPGVYSSAASGIKDIANPVAMPGVVAPNKIWIARWNLVPNVYGHAPYVADSQWSPYRRIHQYRGGHVETYGGVTINIDNDYLDTSSPIIVQMYIDSRANALTWASRPRPDVGAAFPAAGPNHGYTLTMQTTPGRHTVCLFAINAGPGSSSRLGCRATNVP